MERNKTYKKMFKLLWILLAAFSCVFICADVKADIGDPRVYETTINNSDVEYHFGAHNKRCDGIITQYARGDFRGIEKIKVPYMFTLTRCCTNTVLGSYNYIIVYLDGNELYRGDEMEFCDLDSTVSRYEEPVIDISGKGGENSVITIYIMAKRNICETCGNQPIAACIYDGIYFYDYRPKATMAAAEENVPIGGGFYSNPTYNEQVSSIEWGIRFPGESDFTLLTEGENSNGIVASGVKNRSIGIERIPYIDGGFDVGVFVKDAHGCYPGDGTSAQTPFYTHVNTIDSTNPTVSVSKTYDTTNGVVVISATAMDTDSGLSSEAYSWDNGASFTSSNTKGYAEIGTYNLYVRDRAGNIGSANFYIDSNDIKMIKPAVETPSTPVPAQKPTGSSSTSTVKPEEKTGNSSSSSSKRPDTGSTAKDPFEDKKEEKEDYVTPTGNNTVTPRVPSSTTATGNNPSGGGTKPSGNSEIKEPDNLSDNSESVFDKILNNSKEYVISMKEWGNREKTDEEETSSINLSEPEEYFAEGETYADSEMLSDETYSPEPFFKTGWGIFLIVVIMILFIALLAFILFFGVIILAEKETEYSVLSNTEGVRIPVALAFVTYRDGMFSICFRELLDKYDVLYARPGVLFSYMFEGEKLSVRTKFKGEGSHEIAKEIIQKEITVGQRKGAKK